jgi:glycosyltransferase involved in cell wall biosynthesis
LSSIVKQNYPRHKIEIIVADGGSTDNTIKIANSFEVKIIPNPKRLAEYGLQVGILEATGDLIIIFAADNELVGDSWIQNVVEVFSKNKDVSAVWGKLVSGEEDSSLNKYFELVQSDPLNWFMNKNLVKYKALSQICSEGYFLFRVDSNKPLVWGANGLVYRTEKIRPIWMQEGYLGDNDAFQCMVEQGNNKVAYFNTPFVYHHHVAKFSDWISKWERNFIQHFLDKQGTRNMNWVLTKNFKIKLFFWVVYSLFPIFSFLDSIKNLIKDKNIYWLYHSPVSLLQTITYLKVLFKTGKWRQVITLI